MTETPTILTFLDEYGDKSLNVDKSGVTNHFIVAAIIVHPDNADKVRGVIKGISDKYFSGAEVKSSSIGKNDKRRLAILSELENAPFKAVVFAVDKSKLLPTSGLIYKRSFIKYLHGLLFQRLFLAIPRLHMTLDEVGREQFMDGFAKYVKGVHVPQDLFSDHEIAFQDSANEPLIQLADLVAGSMARAYDPKKKTEQSEAVLQALSGKLIGNHHWPARMRGYIEQNEVSDEQDAKVNLYSRRAAHQYLEDNYDSALPEIVLRCSVLNFLLFRLDAQSAGTFTATQVILEALQEAAGQDIGATNLRTNVIGPLRDAGILIVSGPSGYKIGDRTADFREFVAEVDRRVAPQLKRIGIMREAVRSTTQGEVDIFQGGYEHLEEALDAIQKST